MASNSLLSLVQKFAELDQMLIESGGEITPEMEAFFDLTTNDVAQKVDNYKLYIDHLTHRINYFKEIEAKAKDASNLFNNQIDRLKNNIQNCMNSMGMDELLGHDFRYRLVKTRARLIVSDPSKLPPEMSCERTTVEVDKDKVRRALELGFELDGAHLETAKALRNYINTKNTRVISGENKDGDGEQ